MLISILRNKELYRMKQTMHNADNAELMTRKNSNTQLRYKIT